MCKATRQVNLDRNPLWNALRGKHMRQLIYDSNSFTLTAITYKSDKIRVGQIWNWLHGRQQNSWVWQDMRWTICATKPDVYSIVEIFPTWLNSSYKVVQLVTYAYSSTHKL